MKTKSQEGPSPVSGSKARKRWRRAEELHYHLQAVVHLFIERARRASEDSRRYLHQYRVGNDWAHELWLRYRAERRHWMHAARMVLDASFEGGCPDHSTERKTAKIRAEMMAEPVEVAA